MIRVRIRNGELEAQDPIPAEWEGQVAKLVPLTPDDPLPDLQRALRALHAMGPMEYDPGEREANQLGKEQMNALSGRHE
jgi:hypothetical protein